jgi:hypothetical protein
MIPQAEIPEGFVRFAHAVVESPMLRSWFYKLEAVPERDRAAWLLDMARHIEKEDQDLAVTAFKLRDPKICSAVLAAVRDRVGDADSSHLTNR